MYQDQSTFLYISLFLVAKNVFYKKNSDMCWRKNKSHDIIYDLRQ